MTLKKSGLVQISPDNVVDIAEARSLAVLGVMQTSSPIDGDLGSIERSTQKVDDDNDEDEDSTLVRTFFSFSLWEASTILHCQNTLSLFFKRRKILETDWKRNGRICISGKF